MEEEYYGGCNCNVCKQLQERLGRSGYNAAPAEGIEVTVVFWSNTSHLVRGTSISKHGSARNTCICTSKQILFKRVLGVAALQEGG